MSDAARAFADLSNELATTRTVLDRLPDGQFDWAPHEKSMPLGRLAAHMVMLVGMPEMMLATDTVDLAAGRPPAVPMADRAAVLAAFDDAAARTRVALDAATDEALAGTWTLRMGEHTIAAGPRREMLRHLSLSHLIHHRGQMTVYLRLLGVPVPPVYGPTADEGRFA
ncbi:MAG TPA: DinB family protein [Rubricoccaceae bacterium]|jgi:uncharacterized damage-inducible protein DinB